jgi:DNA repair protein RadD
MSYTLRPRQEEAVFKIDRFISETKKNHGLFVYPTSFGKSLVIANMASKYPNKYFINVTNSKELLKQNYEKYTSYGFEAEICSASLNSKNVGKVTFATITTLSKFVKFFEDKEVIIIDDEAQEGSKTGSQLHSFVKQLKNYKLVGVTATPFRLSQGMEGTSLKMMNRDRSCIYKSIEDVVQISEVVEQNYWSKLLYEVKDVDEESLQLNTTGTEFTDNSIQKFKEENDINNRVVEEIKQLLSQGRKSILVSVPFISDAQEIALKLDSCEAVYSGMDTKDRDRIIDSFKSLKLKIIVQCRILSVGFDHPQLDAIIMAKPTNSLTFYYQYLGRGVRIHPDKKDCVVVDLSGNFKRFGKIETISIENSELTKGWAVFNEDMLLSNYPLNTNNRPTKKSLLSKLKWEQSKKEQSVSEEVKFYFGKYKDKSVSEVLKENKSYLTWLLDQKDFNWYGDNGRRLKQSIQRHLGVFLEEEKEIVKNLFKVS